MENVKKHLKALQEINEQREQDMRIMRELMEKVGEIFQNKD